MSWLSNLVETVWTGLATVGKAIVDVAAPVVSSLVVTLRRGVDAIRDALEKEFRAPPANERERIEQDLSEVNERILQLRKRHYERGGLSDYDRREHARLMERRRDLGKELDALDQAITAETIVNEQESYQSLHIDDRLAHILQYHVGQGTFNKKCSVCGRDMVLQWKRQLTVAATHDFYWGCSGYYFKKCKHTEKLSREDFDLFVNAKRREFELAPAELAGLVIESKPTRVVTAMHDLMARGRKLGEGVEGYRCPVHKDRLVLREKREPNSLLDQFFLGCPRYDTDGHGCNYLVKLKSAAQLSAIFDATGEGGLIHVLESSSSTQRPPNAGQPWTTDLDGQLARAYDQKLSIDQLASIFARSSTSIRMRLQKLGKWPADEGGPLM